MSNLPTPRPPSKRARSCRKLSAVEIKAIVRHRDGYRCTECGITAAEHFKRYKLNLDVHRLVPGSPYTVRGCVTLCRRCHGPKPRSPRQHNSRVKLLVMTPSAMKLLEQLAKRNHRPVLWEARLAIENHLRSNGLLSDDERQTD